MIYTVYMGWKTASGGGWWRGEYFKSKQPLSYEALRSQLTLKTSVCFFFVQEALGRWQFTKTQNRLLINLKFLLSEKITFSKTTFSPDRKS